jgi:hypothetical protein
LEKANTSNKRCPPDVIKALIAAVLHSVSHENVGKYTWKEISGNEVASFYL